MITLSSRRELMGRQNSGAILFLFVVAAGYFLPVLLNGNGRLLSSIDGDTWSQFYYWRRFAFTNLLRGELPLWNPYNFSGQPFIAAMQSAVFYPPNWIFLIFDTTLAINLSIALHCLGASCSTYALVRYLGVSPIGAVLSALTFAYGAPYLLRIYPGHLTLLAATWIPLVFLALEGLLRDRNLKFAVCGGACLAMILLAGAPQIFFYCFAASFFYYFLHFSLRGEARRLPSVLSIYGVFVGFALLLAAVQLLPAWELVQHSARSEVSFEWISLFSIPPENLLTLLLPNLFGDIVTVAYWGRNNLWEMSLYLGLVPLIMIVIAVVLDRQRQVMVFGVIGLVFLLLTLGRHTPFLWFAYSFLPGFGFFRGVAKAAIIVALSGAVLAGYGCDKLRQLIDLGDRKLYLIGFAALVVGVVIIVSAFLSPAGDPFSWSPTVKSYSVTEEHFEALRLDDVFFALSRTLVWIDIWKASSILSLFGLLCLLSGKIRTHWRSRLIVAMIILAAADLWHFGSRFMVTFDPHILSMDSDLKAYLKNDPQPFRIATPLGRLRNYLLNAGMAEGIANVGGYDAIVIKDYNDIVNLTQGLPLEEPNLLMGINRISPILNFLNVKYYLVEPNTSIDLPGFEVVFENSHHRLYRNQNAMPRSFVVHRTRFIAGRQATLRHMSRPDFDPANVAILSDPAAGLVDAVQARSPAPVVSLPKDRQVVIDAEAAAPGLLVLADAYYPGWKAYIDGEEAKIYRINHVMRGVVLTQGPHHVEFRYEPLSFRVGATMTGIGLLLAGVLLLFCKSNQPASIGVKI